MMPLSFFKAGESARVMRVGGTDATRKHLGSLGFSAGALVRVIEDADGGKIVGIHDSRLALNDDLARRIECEALRNWKSGEVEEWKGVKCQNKERSN